MSFYSLKTILATFTNSNGKKRILLNGGPIGGLNSIAIILFFIALPFLEYAAIFNPYIFNLLGIATSIVLFIVGLSIVMIIIFFVVWRVKSNIIKKITPSWNHYFPNRDITLVLSSGITPYNKFFEFYAQKLEKDFSEEMLHKHLLNGFKTMEEENKDLIEAIRKDKKIQ